MNFNSIKVRLELDGPFAHELDGVNFNSIKVRLELKLADDWYIPSLFQFHKGAIRTQLR